MLTPIIKGIACTDESGRLFYEDGDRKRLIARHPNVASWVAPLDFSLFKQFLNKNWLNGTLVVIGPNTFNDAMRLLLSHQSDRLSTIMVSYPDHYQLIHSMHTDNVPFAYQTEDTLTGLRLAARQFSADNDIKQILVLGGRSVYNAFAGHYDHFTHCEVSTHEADDDAKGAIDIADLMPVNGDNQYHKIIPCTEDGYCVTQYQRMHGQMPS